MTGRPYRGVRPRPRMPGAGLKRGWDPTPTPDPPGDLIQRSVAAGIREPFVGLTSDGVIIPNLFPIEKTGQSTKPIVDAARAYIASLSRAEHSAGVLPVRSQSWREWTNAFPRWTPHGILFEDMAETQRERALDVISASMSTRGFEQARNVMKLNEALGELIDTLLDTLREWIYWFTIFGEPSEVEPWGWQVVGHHLDLHCFLLGEQLVFTPSFMGAEFCEPDDGPFKGINVFERERERALAFVHSLSSEQLDTAILYHSILKKDLPLEFKHPSEGRMRTVAGRDNVVVPYEGLPSKQLDSDQRSLLLAVIETYVGQIREPHAKVKMSEVARHLDNTHFCWIGGTGAADAFYYKVQSPVICIEYDCHTGVFLEADEPLPYHVHTVVRTPNGNDYGKDLLAQHLAAFPH